MKFSKKLHDLVSSGDAFRWINEIKENGGETRKLYTWVRPGLVESGVWTWIYKRKILLYEEFPEIESFRKNSGKGKINVSIPYMSSSKFLHIVKSGSKKEKINLFRNIKKYKAFADKWNINIDINDDFSNYTKKLTDYAERNNEDISFLLNTNRKINKIKFVTLYFPEADIRSISEDKFIFYIKVISAESEYSHNGSTKFLSSKRRYRLTKLILDKELSLEDVILKMWVFPKNKNLRQTLLKRVMNISARSREVVLILTFKIAPSTGGLNLISLSKILRGDNKKIKNIKAVAKIVARIANSSTIISFLNYVTEYKTNIELRKRYDLEPKEFPMQRADKRIFDIWHSKVADDSKKIIQEHQKMSIIAAEKKHQYNWEHSSVLSELISCKNITPIIEMKNFANEGKNMSHCVENYKFETNYAFFNISLSDDFAATAQVDFEENNLDKPKIIQIYGKNNKELNKSQIHEVFELTKMQIDV